VLNVLVDHSMARHLKHILIKYFLVVILVLFIVVCGIYQVDVHRYVL
jgi:hypothetical protein